MKRATESPVAVYYNNVIKEEPLQKRMSGSQFSSINPAPFACVPRSSSTWTSISCISKRIPDLQDIHSFHVLLDVPDRNIQFLQVYTHFPDTDIQIMDVHVNVILYKHPFSLLKWTGISIICM